MTDHHELSFTHPDTRSGWHPLPSSYLHSALKLFDLDVGCRSVVIFKRVVIVVKAGPLRRRRPEDAIMAIDSSTLRSVADCKGACLGGPLVENVLDKTFPAVLRH